MTCKICNGTGWLPVDPKGGSSQYPCTGCGLVVWSQRAPRNISECCGAPDGSTTEDGPSWSDIGICPECKDHCEFIEPKEDE